MVMVRPEYRDQHNTQAAVNRDHCPEAVRLVVTDDQPYLARPAADFLAKVAPGGCVLDVKGALDLDALRRSGCVCWRL